MHIAAQSPPATPYAAGMHLYLLLISRSWILTVSAAVIFGDLGNGQTVANVPAAKLKKYCAQGDGVCGTPRT